MNDSDTGMLLEDHSDAPVAHGAHTNHPAHFFPAAFHPSAVAHAQSTPRWLLEGPSPRTKPLRESLPAASPRRNQLCLFLFEQNFSSGRLGKAERGRKAGKPGLQAGLQRDSDCGVGGGVSSPFQRAFNRKQMLRAQAPRTGSAAGFPSSTLPAESILIKIFKFKHEARGSGSREWPGLHAC